MNKSQPNSTENEQEPVKVAGNHKGADGLTVAQRLFVTEYLKDGNASKAAIRAGYSPETAGSQGCRLLKNAKIKQIIEQVQQEALETVQKETGINLERTLREIARLAFFDPRKLFLPSGEPLSIQDLDEDTAASIAGLEVLEEFEGQGKDRKFIGYTKKFKLADKRASLDMLMKHLGGYKEDNKQSGEAAAGTVAAVLAEMRGRNCLAVVKDVTDDE